MDMPEEQAGISKSKLNPHFHLSYDIVIQLKFDCNISEAADLKIYILQKIKNTILYISPSGTIFKGAIFQIFVAF